MATEKFSSLQGSTRRAFIRQALCAAVGTSALSNTIRDLRYINVAMAQSAPAISDYKALVCIFLNGGNDANNLIIPTIAEEYANYANIRTPALALPNAGVTGGALSLNITNGSGDGHSYGFHPACTELQALFNNRKLTTVFNVGTLVYPITKAEYTSGAVSRPPQLFSHADQQQQWQTSISDRPQATGWGGRCADLLDTYNPKNGNTSVLSMCISLAGANLFEVGGVVQQYNVSTSGAASLNPNYPPSAARSAQTLALNNIIGIDAVQANMLTQNYALALDHALDSGTSLTAALAGTKMATYWANTYPKNVVVPNGGGTIFNASLLAQLQMVAKSIEAGYRAASSNNGLGMKRQIFFVQVGGYDLHTGQTNNSGQTTTNNATVVLGAQANLLAELSQGLNAFQNALQTIGSTYGDSSFDSRVTTFTSSDFGRTLPCNGLGSDHGWGSHHLVMGGSVNGGRTYGKFPALVVGGPDDTSTGRWIPTTSVDQFAATMASWFGVDNSKMATVFPNLGRFSVPNLGFLNSI